jgi:lysophospholipase L1-like esterase
MSTARSLVGSAVAASLVGASALEFTVRLDDWAQFGVPLSAPAVAMSELAVRDSLGFHARAGVHYRQYRINRWGFRGSDVDPATRNGSLVFAAGASETFGLYESPGRDWPQQLQDSLQQCARPVHVLNAAFAGMSLPTVRQDFVRRLQPHAPAVWIYYPTPMQYLASPLPTAAEPLPGAIEPLSPWRSRALPRFRDAIKRGVPEPLLDLGRTLMTARARKVDVITARTTVDQDRLDAFERDLRVLVGTVRGAGTTPILMVHANRFTDTTSLDARRMLTAWERFYPEYTGTAIVRFDAAAAERTRTVAADSGIMLVDPRARLRTLGPSAFRDFGHFNDSGAAAVAGEAARALQPLLCGDSDR